MTGGGLVVDRDVIEAAGADAVDYLQGQLSQDVTGMAVGASTWTFALQPTGKVDAWFRVTRLGNDRFVLDVDGGHGEALVARLERFRLRTAVEFTALSWTCVAVRGIPVADVDVGSAEIVADPAWPGCPGIDLLGSGAVVPPGAAALDPVDLERMRIRAGVPAMGTELRPDTIPAEAGVVARSVDFAKGCFTGQELVARIDSRGGNVPRRLRVVQGDGDVPPERAAIEHDGREVGAITSAVMDGAGWVALGYVGRAVDPPAPVTVAGAAATVTATP